MADIEVEKFYAICQYYRQQEMVEVSCIGLDYAGADMLSLMRERGHRFPSSC